jgi:hypothetical protein
VFFFSVYEFIFALASVRLPADFGSRNNSISVLLSNVFSDNGGGDDKVI